MNSYIYSYNDIDEIIDIVNNWEDIVKEWKAMYLDFDCQYQIFLNEDQTISVILNVYQGVKPKDKSRK